MYRYKITDASGKLLCMVMAKGHNQRIWNEGDLTGVSAEGIKKLEALGDGPLYYSHDGNGTAQNIKLKGWWKGQAG